LEKTSTVKDGFVVCATAPSLSKGLGIAETTRSNRKPFANGPADRRHPELTGLCEHRNFRLTITRLKDIAMKWKTPVIIEIAVGLEINAYACAEVK
jgi:coenzyme PQQ precursor peptide PqqA